MYTRILKDFLIVTLFILYNCSSAQALEIYELPNSPRTDEDKSVNIKRSIHTANRHHKKSDPQNTDFENGFPEKVTSDLFWALGAVAATTSACEIMPAYSPLIVSTALVYYMTKNSIGSLWSGGRKDLNNLITSIRKSLENLKYDTNKILENKYRWLRKTARSLIHVCMVVRI